MATPPLWSHTTALTADPPSASLARDFVRGHLLRHGLPSMVDTLRLAASELATNAMVHAQTPFTVHLSRTDHRVLLVVEDDSAKAPVPVASQALDDGGRGLAILAAISQGWGVTAAEGGAKSVWASFDVPHRTP